MMPGDRPLQLLRDSTKWIVERAKEACKEEIIGRMRGEDGKQRREDMGGLVMLDIPAATALWRGRVKRNLKVHTAKERWLLADLITGAIRPMRRLWRAKRWHDTMRVVQKVQGNGGAGNQEAHELGMSPVGGYKRKIQKCLGQERH